MKAVVSAVPPEVLEQRRRLGIDRYDEMWGGVLHVPPIATFEHNDFQWSLQDYLKRRWARPKNATVGWMNVALPGGWPEDYRVPDIILWTRERNEMNKQTHFEGPPDVAIEIKSPGDESHEKLPFYAALGVGEVWVIDRDTKEPEVHFLRGGAYEKQAPEAGGWVTSAFTRIEMRATGRGKLAVRSGADDMTLEELPAD